LPRSFEETVALPTSWERIRHASPR
jgi:hypothetical protein